MANKHNRKVAAASNTARHATRHHTKFETKPINIFLILIWLVFIAGMVAHYYYRWF